MSNYSHDLLKICGVKFFINDEDITNYCINFNDDFFNINTYELWKIILQDIKDMLFFNKFFSNFNFNKENDEDYISFRMYYDKNNYRFEDLIVYDYEYDFNSKIVNLSGYYIK